MLDKAATELKPEDAIPLCTEAIEQFKLMRKIAGEDDDLLHVWSLSIAEAFSQRGHQFRYAKNYKESLPDLSQAVRYNPDLVSDYYYRALSYQHLGDQKAVRNDLTQYLRYGKDDYLRTEAQSRLNALVPQNNAPVKVIHLGTEGARLASEASGLMNPGEGGLPNPDQAVYLYNQALVSFEKALELSPKDVLARAGKLTSLSEQAECYIAIQEYDLAIENYNQALELNANPRHLFRRGEVYRLAGQRELARRDFADYLKMGDDLDLKEQAKTLLAGKPETAGASS